MSWGNRDRSVVPRVGVSVPVVVPGVGLRARVVRARVRTVTGPWARTSTIVRVVSAVAISAGRRVRATTIDCAERDLVRDRDRGFV